MGIWGNGGRGEEVSEEGPEEGREGLDCRGEGKV